MSQDAAPGCHPILCVALLCSVGAAPCAAAPREVANRMTARELVARSAAVAERKLRREDCGAVLSDFRDPAGRLLSDVVTSRAGSAAAYFASLTFLDGSSVPRCSTGRVAAGATLGSPFIAICKETFARTQAEDPGLAANVLIHEMLHALGLGEDPPTSEEITRQVARRCGR